MKITGSSVLSASPDRVWAAITDPAVLATVIPGCNVLTPIETNRFAVTVTLGVASIKGEYTGEVALQDLREPTALTMRANGSGAPGTIDTTVVVSLTALDGGTTRIDYDGEAMVGGMVGGVGQRVLVGVAKKTAGLFFLAIDGVLTGERPVTAAPVTASAPGPAAPGTAAAASFVPSTSPPRQSVVKLLGAAAFGAGSVLVGVFVGARIARRR
jgi:carbon monoxide dehydrogenase subunit G